MKGTVTKLIPSHMFGSYLSAAFRNLKKNLGYSAINLLGLSLGLTVSLLILLFVQHETSYDSFHEAPEDIYRIVLDGTFGGNGLNAPVAPAPMGRTLVADYPEVLQSARVFGFGGERIIRQEDEVFSDTKIVLTDSSLFELFSFEFLRGDPSSALTRPNTIVLTKSLAQKLFGEEDAYGQTVTMGDTTQVEVDGIIADPPSNSNFQFSAYQTLLDFPAASGDQWISNNYVTHIRLLPGSDPSSLIAKLPIMFETYAGPQLNQFLGISYDEFVEGGNVLAYTLQAMGDVHLKSSFEIDIITPGSMTYVILFSVVAVFILLLACINFMNLATARSATRAREVGVRKAVGSSRVQLIFQFLGESALMTSMALILALFFLWAAMPTFNQMTGQTLLLSTIMTPSFISTILGGAIVVSILAGLYPALFLSSFNPAVVLKTETFAAGSRSMLRNALVVFQFSISISLLIGTFVVQDQLSFIQNKPLGFDREQIVVLSRTGNLADQYDAFKDQLLEYSGISAVGGSSSLPGTVHGGNGYVPEGGTIDQPIILSPVYVDNDFVEAMGIRMSAGRDFSEDFPSDSGAVYLNQAALSSIGWDDAIGRTIGEFSGADPDNPLANYEIIGIIEDYHFMSLRSEIGGAVYQMSPVTPQNSVIRIAGSDIQGTLDHIQATWSEFQPDTPISLNFMNDNFNNLAASDQRLGRLFTGFSFFAIMIASLGLFGLAFFVTEQRTKEIGIRKALGATVGEVVVMLSKDFTRLVLVSIAVSIPIGYFGMNSWLDGFAYRTDLNIWAFVVAGLLAISISWLTVSYQSIKAARSNPIKALRHG